jgi:Bacterial pre-peptidase C-terminal domain
MFSMRNRVADQRPLPDVVVHAPAGFDARAPLHLVFMMHGMGHQALWWAGGGLTDPRTGRRVQGWGGEVRHDLAGVRSLFVAPQFEIRPGRSHQGRFATRGVFRAFVDELLAETLASRLGGPRTLADVASITLVGSSAGGPMIASLLAHDDLDGRVKNVVLFDSLYGSEDVFARWLRGGEDVNPRRLVCVHAGSRYTAGHVARLAALLRPSLRDQVAVQPREAMTDAVRAHRAVFATVNCEHICMGSAYLDKILRGLDLPPRAGDDDPKALTSAAVRAALPMPDDGISRGALTDDDPRLRDGSRFDDYALELAEGERVTVDLRGGATRGFLCRTLDVELRVLDGDRVLAADDDGGGALASRITLRAPRTGRFIVRVTTHGPWANLGEYTLRVTRSTPPPR